jgi:hypothetical protein
MSLGWKKFLFRLHPTWFEAKLHNYSWSPQCLMELCGFCGCNWQPVRLTGEWCSHMRLHINYPWCPSSNACDSLIVCHSLKIYYGRHKPQNSKKPKASYYGTAEIQLSDLIEKVSIAASSWSSKSSFLLVCVLLQCYCSVWRGIYCVYFTVLFVYEMTEQTAVKCKAILRCRH